MTHAPPTHKGETLPPEPAKDISMTRNNLTQTDGAKAESDLRRSLRAFANGTDPGYLGHLNSHDRQVFNASDVLALLDALDAAEAEVERLQGGLERAHEELRQGWPKMTYEANRAAIEAMNERDEARAEVERLGQALARVHALHAREDIPAFVYRITDEDGTRDEPHEPFSRCVHCGGSTYPCKTIETNPYL